MSHERFRDRRRRAGRCRVAELRRRGDGTQGMDSAQEKRGVEGKRLRLKLDGRRQESTPHLDSTQRYQLHHQIGRNTTHDPRPVLGVLYDASQMYVGNKQVSTVNLVERGREERVKREEDRRDGCRCVCGRVNLCRFSPS